MDDPLTDEGVAADQSGAPEPQPNLENGSQSQTKSKQQMGKNQASMRKEMTSPPNLSSIPELLNHIQAEHKPEFQM